MYINRLRVQQILKYRYTRNDGGYERLTDGMGLWIRVDELNRKQFRFDYRVPNTKKRKTLVIDYFKESEQTIGPGITLAKARDERDRYKEMLDKGIDPAIDKKINLSRVEGDLNKNSLFKDAFENWFKIKNKNNKPKSIIVKRNMADNHVLPILGELPVTEIKPKTIEYALNAIEVKANGSDNNYIPTISRSLSMMKGVFMKCVREGLIDYNPAASISLSDYGKHKVKHQATTVVPREISKILFKLYDYSPGPTGMWQITIAMKLLPYLMCRPGEVATLKWDAVNFDDRIITIADEEMKMGEKHQIPMAEQVYSLLKDAEKYRKESAYVFPGRDNKSTSITTGGLLGRLRSCGIKPTELCNHGWRSMASTRLNEGISRDGSLDMKDNNKSFDWNAIEIQLAHKDSTVRGAYNHATYVESRRPMMQEWANYLDNLRTSSNL
jgi:integrase